MMKVEEPLAAYNTQSVQYLKNRLIVAIDNSSDKELLSQCLELLESSPSSMPCVFTEEEFDEEIILSEAEGYASENEVSTIYSKWGVVV